MSKETKADPIDQLRVFAACLPESPAKDRLYLITETLRYKLIAKNEECERLTHERGLVSKALGDILVAAGVIRLIDLTGPQLLLVASAYIKDLNGGTK